MIEPLSPRQAYVAGQRNVVSFISVWWGQLMAAKLMETQPLPRIYPLGRGNYLGLFNIDRTT